MIPMRRWLFASLVLIAGTVACSGNATAPADSAALASQGAQIAAKRGCATCHTVSGVNTVAPTWKGLAGSNIELADGSVVVADTDYLARSIADPNAQRVKGYSLLMPRLGLPKSEIDALVAYIESLR